MLSASGFGALCALGSALTWAAISVVFRTLPPSFNSVTINAVRSSVSGALVLAWLALSGGAGGLAAMTLRTFGLLALSIAIATGVGDTVFFESTRSLGVGRAMAISMTYPLIAAGLAAAFLGEALTLRLTLGALLALGGLVLIVTANPAEAEGEARSWLGVGAAGLAALAWAVSVVVMKAPLREIDATTAQAVRLPVAGALLWATPWARRAAPRLRASGPDALWRMAGLGVLTALSSVMFVAGLKYAGVAVATVLSSTAPMFAIPLGLVFLGERLQPAALAGAVLTVAGIAVLQL